MNNKKYFEKILFLFNILALLVILFLFYFQNKNTMFNLKYQSNQKEVIKLNNIEKASSSIIIEEENNNNDLPIKILTKKEIKNLKLKLQETKNLCLLKGKTTYKNPEIKQLEKQLEKLKFKNIN